MTTYDDPDPAWGMVTEEGRGSLPYSLLHGESLVACAAWALGEAGVEIVDLTLGWEAVRDSGRTLCLHDPLCPATPADFVADCVRRAEEAGQAVVGWRPVTDTVKTWDADRLGATVDRDTLRVVTSPLVLPAAVVARLPGLPTTDLADLVVWLATDHDLVWLTAPSQGRRIASADDLRLLAALTGPRR